MYREPGQHYPYLVRAFASIPQGDNHLRRLQDLNARWQQMHCSHANDHTTDVLLTEERPTCPPEDTFDIIYAGGSLNLLHAAVMAHCYGQRVLVFDRFIAGAVHREWNISREELEELLLVGLLTPDELESIIQRQYNHGLVHFSSHNIQAIPAQLKLQGVLNVAVDLGSLSGQR